MSVTVAVAQSVLQMGYCSTGCGCKTSSLRKPLVYQDPSRLVLVITIIIMRGLPHDNTAEGTAE